MPPKEFKYFISEDAFVSVFFRTNRGVIADFVVKLNAIIDGRAYEIVRFDTAHGGVHKDVLRPDGTKEKVVQFRYLTYKQGLDLATTDVEEHMEFYIERFKKWLKQKGK